MSKKIWKVAPRGERISGGKSEKSILDEKNTRYGKEAPRILKEPGGRGERNSSG